MLPWIGLVYVNCPYPEVAMHILADAKHGDEGIEIVSDHVLDPVARPQVFDCTTATSRLFNGLWNVYA
jgi:hypothetical protein